MNKSKRKNLLIILIAVTIFISIILITLGYLFKFKSENNNNWVLQTRNDYIVLLKNGEIVEVFGDISVEDLPKEDKNHLKSGIKFLSKEEAMLAIEDYDG